MFALSEGILVASIGAGAVIIAAIFTAIGKDATKSKKAAIKQKAKGNNNTLIGLQITQNQGENNDI